jgi:hypothetical protein
VAGDFKERPDSSSTSRSAFQSQARSKGRTQERSSAGRETGGGRARGAGGFACFFRMEMAMGCGAAEGPARGSDPAGGARDQLRDQRGQKPQIWPVL